MLLPGDQPLSPRPLPYASDQPGGNGVVQSLLGLLRRPVLHRVAQGCLNCCAVACGKRGGLACREPSRMPPGQVLDGTGAIRNLHRDAIATVTGMAGHRAGLGMAQNRQQERSPASARRDGIASHQRGAPRCHVVMCGPLRIVLVDIMEQYREGRRSVPACPA